MPLVITSPTQPFACPCARATIGASDSAAINPADNDRVNRIPCISFLLESIELCAGGERCPELAESCFAYADCGAIVLTDYRILRRFFERTAHFLHHVVECGETRSVL